MAAKSSDPVNEYECINIIPNGYVAQHIDRTGKQGKVVSVKIWLQI